MRGLSFGALTLCALAVGTTAVHADGDKEARAVVDKAIKAVGGEAKLAQLRNVTLKTKTTIQGGNMELSFSADGSCAELDKLLIDGELGGMALRAVLSPKACWRQLGGKVEDANQHAVPSIRKLLYALRTAQILLPLKDNAVTLAHGGEVKIGERPAVMLKATHKDYGEVDFYFDKETGLPAKYVTRAVLGPDNKEQPFECALSEYKDIEGMKHWTKISFTIEEFDMKIKIETRISDIKPAMLDETLFAKPE